MKIELSKPFARNSKVDEYDTRQVKKSLNRLGYYQPYEKTGITGIPDQAIFDALKKFQEHYGLRSTGEARPGDETIQTLNEETAKTPDGYYIWRTVGDDKVRESHAILNKTVRAWSDSPDPGEDIGCRCWAEPILGLVQKVISPIKDLDKWDWTDFVQHYYFGQGKSVSLSEIGLMSDVIDHVKLTIFSRVEKQIEKKVKSIGNGNFTDTFSRWYDFNDASFSLGRSTLSGKIKGSVTRRTTS